MSRTAVLGRSRPLLSILTPLVLAAPVAAGSPVCFVDDDAPAGGDGTAWATAFRTLDAALDAAAVPGSPIDVIRIGGGTYLPPRPQGKEANAREATFVLVSGVSIEGGYAGLAGGDPDQRDLAAHPTVLSGDLDGDDAPAFANRDDNAYQVVTAFDLDEATIIDGLTIRGGEAFGARLGDVRESADQGAAIHLWGGSPTFRNVTIDDNRALSHGIVNDHSEAARFESCRFTNGATESHAAGLYCSPTSATLVVDCHFEGNRTEGNGGGLYNDGSKLVTCLDSTFADNDAVRGSGVFTSDGSSATITGCTFTSNRATRAGAGIFNSVNQTVVSNCSFIGNDAFEAEGGGGIWNENGAPIITDCLFMQNVALQGAGVYSIDAEPMILRCTFIENEAQTGGATWNDGGHSYTADCTFIDNFAVTGGGVYNETGEAIIVNCTFTGNLATGGDGGGGITNSFNSLPTIVGCTFTENVAINGLFGGGGGLANYVATATIHDCTFTRNSASLSGGAIYTEANDPAGPCYVSHCTFEGNRAADGAAIHLFRSSPFINHCVFVGNAIEGEGTGRGGAIYNHFICYPEITNCTMIDNVAPFGPAFADADLSEPFVANCIAWNSDGSDVVWGDQTTFAYSLVRSAISGDGVIDADPLIASLPDPGADAQWGTDDDDYGDLTLTAASPAIDAGHNGLVARDRADLDDDADVTEYIALDHAGAARFQDVTGTGCGAGATVDLGAFEFAGVPHDVRVGDLDGDGAVALPDLIAVLAAWGACPDACCLADLDRSGTVDFNDLLEVLGRWSS